MKVVASDARTFAAGAHTPRTEVAQPCRGTHEPTERPTRQKPAHPPETNDEPPVGSRSAHRALIGATMHALKHPATARATSATSAGSANRAAPRSPRIESARRLAQGSGTCFLTTRSSLREAPRFAGRHRPSPKDLRPERTSKPDDCFRERNILGAGWGGSAASRDEGRHELWQRIVRDAR
jgi:hypothetical protein